MMYLPFQAVHAPLQAPARWVANYSWLTNTKRRTMAAMTSCLDEQLQRIADALKAARMWEDVVFAFSADNGGPPYVANSNWPLRGGKWTSWEGGTHLTGFVHSPKGLPAPPKKTKEGNTIDYVDTSAADGGYKEWRDQCWIPRIYESSSKWGDQTASTAPSPTTSNLSSQSSRPLSTSPARPAPQYSAVEMRTQLNLG